MTLATLSSSGTVYVAIDLFMINAIGWAKCSAPSFRNLDGILSRPVLLRASKPFKS